jgi:isoleucyl-tRNA synthetase
MPEGNADDPGPGALVRIQARVLEFWEKNDLPHRLAHGTPGGPIFRFSEGPPTANGVPHIGHVISRALKDTVLRYRRLRGHEIQSAMAGWDCHGLPVELEVEKRHGLKSKKEIEAYGVERFCAECRENALEVVAAWQEMSRQLGYWLDYRRPYMTMDAPYIESVWWSLKTLFDRGMLEKGYYSLPYCPRCETPLSSHEVAQGWRETTDPSVTVRVPLAGTPPGAPTRYLLLWTTTPWTLPANLLVAARADLTYAVLRMEDGSEAVLAESAIPRYFPGDSPPVVERSAGTSLAGRTYTPPFPYAGPGRDRYRVVLDDSVDAREGTGLVHIAPSFGPEDQRIGEREGVGVLDPLDSRGVFTAAVPPVAGKSFKAADPILLGLLREEGKVVRAETIRHTYPYCWRCGTALLYRALDSWFVRTSRITEELVAHNRQVTWFPAYLREGRFGNFLTEAKDWALSRNRYWGTPLPIWRCPNGHTTCIGSFAELGERRGEPVPPGFDPHRVGVDAIHFPCSTCGATTQREPYTIDAWYDSGSAPFARYHYPFAPGPFEPEKSLDFVAEGLDQTRGWFYTLLVLATALFHRPAYRVCVSNGLVLDEAGLKMSKSKGNVLEPMALLTGLGGDGVRWWFLTTNFTEPMRASEKAFRQAAQRTLGTLLHVHEFYRSNREADDLVPRLEAPSPENLLDRWLLSRLAATAEVATRSLETFELREGALALRAFVDELSTWYLRRSRPRFWNEEGDAARRAADGTLSFALFTVARLLAPYTPFVAEHLYQELTGAQYEDGARTVHTSGWPGPLPGRDVELEAAMEDLRAFVEVGRDLRQRAEVRSRIPLSTLVVRAEAPPAFAALGEEGLRLLADELNVKEVRWQADPPADGAGPWISKEGPRGAVVHLSRRPTPELAREGLVREALRRLQRARKEMRLEFTDRIRLSLRASPELFEALKENRERLARELLADEMQIERGGAAASDDGRLRWTWDEESLEASIERAAAPPASS